MMGNKWVQASILFGTAIGILLGGWVALIWPTQPIFLVLPIPIGLLAGWIEANARGTDGWGGPWNGPK